MSIRRARPADTPALVRQVEQAAQAGQYGEWGGIPPQDVGRQIAQPEHEVWAVLDAAGMLRGYIRMDFAGYVRQAPELSGRGALIWRYALGVIDPSLAPLVWSRLYLESVREVAERHAGDMLEGSVVAGSALDRLWQHYLAGWRSVREEAGVGIASYRLPAVDVVSSLAGA